MEDEGVEVLRAADLELGLGVGLRSGLGLGTSDGLGGLDQGLLDARRGGVLAAGDLDWKVSICSRALRSVPREIVRFHAEHEYNGTHGSSIRLSFKVKLPSYPCLPAMSKLLRSRESRTSPSPRFQHSVLQSNRTISRSVPTRSIRTEALDVGDLLRHRGRVAGCKFQVVETLVNHQPISRRREQIAQLWPPPRRLVQHPGE